MTSQQPLFKWWQRLGQRFGASKVGGWMLLNITTYTDPLLMRLSRGRVHSGILGGIPCALLTTTGAKSGLERTVPLAILADGDKFILVASNAGSPKNPAWYYNLIAHPKAILTINGSTGVYIAHEAVGEERQRVWEKATEALLGYEVYQQRAGSRQIPVMILEPRKE
jgi:deazaflavin-dependent oxidoreductase (nitroreductase family)